MKRASYKLRKPFTVLMMLVVIFGCIFASVSALGEEDAVADASTEQIVQNSDGIDSSVDDSQAEKGSSTGESSDVASNEVSEGSALFASTNGNLVAEAQSSESANSENENVLNGAVEIESEDESGATTVPALPVTDGVLCLESDATLSGGENGSWRIVWNDAEYTVENLDYVIVNGDVTLTLSDFSLESSNGPAIAVESGDVPIVLEGSSSLKGAPGCAGIYVAPEACLTIAGDGSLHAQGGTYRASLKSTYYGIAGPESDGPAYLKQRYVGIEGALFYYSSAAGIGGNGMVAYRNGTKYASDALPSFGAITVESGTVVAEGGSVTDANMGAAAGIGSGGLISVGSKESGLTGQVFISGGNVTAVGGAGDDGSNSHGGAGIGAGGTSGNLFSANLISVEISGGDVTSTGGHYAAGIGGGNNVYAGPITIVDGTVRAYAGVATITIGGAGIGGGENAGSRNITITGGTVEAYGSGSGAGIGAGCAGGIPYLNSSNEREYMTISIGGNANVTAYGGPGKAGAKNGGSGIGLGAKLDDWDYDYNLGFESISISDEAVVRAYAGPGAQAIGMGTDYNGEIYQPSSSKLSPSNSISFNGSGIDVWMFTSDTTQGAFFGQSTDDPGVLSDSVKFTGCNGVWHTEGGSSSDDLYVSDAKYEGEFGWAGQDEGDGSTTIYVNFLGVPTVHENNAGYQGNWAAVNAHEPDCAVTLTPVSITSYVGGTSASGSHIPVLRYDVDTAGAGGVDPANLTYELYTQYRTPSSTCEHEDELACEHVTATKASSNGSYYTFDALEADMGGVEDVGEAESETPSIDTTCQKSAYLKLVDTSTGEGMDTVHAGVYRIMLRTNATTHWVNWFLVATDKTTGEKYLVKVDAPSTLGDVAADDATVTVRFVSTEDEMYAYTDEGKDQSENESVLLTKVRTTTERSTVDTSSGAVAVADPDTVFATNGDSRLGVLGESVVEEGANDILETYVDEDSAKIALLFDDVLPEGVAGAAGSEGLASLLETARPDIDLSEYEAQYKYLDLVNFADGNAQVTADRAVTVYWPYPDGVTYETASEYEFRIMHYKGLEREYMTGDNEADGVEELSVEATPYGLKFTTASFSPFTLLWKETVEEPAVDATETPEDPAQAVPDDAKQEDPSDETNRDDSLAAVTTGGKIEASATQRTQDAATATKTSDSGALAVVKPVTGTTTSPSTYDATVPAALLGDLGAVGAGLAALGLKTMRKDRKR